MKIGITYDADAEVGLDEVIFGVNQAFIDHFGDRFYDDSGYGTVHSPDVPRPALELQTTDQIFEKRKHALCGHNAGSGSDDEF
jgi:hypothetical protein